MNDLEAKLFMTHAADQWKRIGAHNHHGICIPLFSLHTEKSSGIGEYLDLLPLISWCKEVGLDVIQLLPLNDIGLGTSPYNAISAFALSPLYISLHSLKGIEKVEGFKENLTKIRYWNKTPRVKYHIVRELKLSLLKSYYDVVFDSVSQSKEYLAFVAENEWLIAYSLFRTIKERQLWKEWEKWPEEYKNLSSSQIKQAYNQNKALCDFSIFLQFLCHEQMSQVKEYATKKGVLLKGDIPILISRDSADVWAHPELFKMEYAAGAPPDMYTKQGQYWGFPIYNWQALAETDYAWWKERLRLASHLYHLYRIDHVVGFYRMWAIPIGKAATEGAFIPSTESEQKELGNQLMQMMLHSAPILPIGEDLGLVPDWVKESLYDLGICGTKMMRWERRWDSDGGFIDPQKYEPMTMSTVSTHDSDTLTLWWRHFPKEAKLYSEYKGWAYEPFLSKEHLKEILYDAHHSSSLFHINLLAEYLALFEELVSSNPNDERINIPGKILDRNWTYRLHVPLEEMTAHKGLKELIQSLVRP